MVTTAGPLGLPLAMMASNSPERFRRRAQWQPSLPLVRYVLGRMSLPTRQIPSSKLLAGSCGFGLGLVVGGVVVTGVAAANTPEYCGHR